MRDFNNADALSDYHRALRDSTPFVEEFNRVQRAVHMIARVKGWWDEDRNEGEIIALVHSEASEWLEAMRNGNPQSDKIPMYSAAEEEIADIIIRLMDVAEKRNYRIASAILDKMQHNAGRPKKHGKEF